jgi:hypothetical protein
MDYHAPKRAVNRLLLHYAGRAHRPVFFDIDQVCLALLEIDRAFAQIQAECDALLAGRVAMPRYHDINRPATAISATTAGDWKVFMLEVLGHKPAAKPALHVAGRRERAVR